MMTYSRNNDMVYEIHGMVGAIDPATNNMINNHREELRRIHRACCKMVSGKDTKTNHRIGTLWRRLMYTSSWFAEDTLESSTYDRYKYTYDRSTKMERSIGNSLCLLISILHVPVDDIKPLIAPELAPEMHNSPRFLQLEDHAGWFEPIVYQKLLTHKRLISLLVRDGELKYANKLMEGMSFNTVGLKETAIDNLKAMQALLHIYREEMIEFEIPF